MDQQEQARELCDFVKFCSRVNNGYKPAEGFATPYRPHERKWMLRNDPT
jgi:hypothetical protein